MVQAEDSNKAYELNDVRTYHLTMPAYTIKMKVYQRSPRAYSLSSFSITFTTTDSTPMDTMNRQKLASRLTK
jgi:hypothetical protein